MYTHTEYIYQPSDLQEFWFPMTCTLQFWPKSCQVLMEATIHILQMQKVSPHTPPQELLQLPFNQADFFTGVQHLLELGHSHPA